MDGSEPSNGANSKKETARDVRKRNKRLEESRDELKTKSRQQASTIKALKGKASDLQDSRDLWKERCDKEVAKKKCLEIELKAEKQRSDQLATLAQERERLLEMKKNFQDEEKAKYEQEIAELKKKLVK